MSWKKEIINQVVAGLDDAATITKEAVEAAAKKLGLSADQTKEATRSLEGRKTGDIQTGKIETPYSPLARRPGAEAGFTSDIPQKSGLALPEGRADSLVKKLQTNAGPESKAGSILSGNETAVQQSKGQSLQDRLNQKVTPEEIKQAEADAADVESTREQMQLFRKEQQDRSGDPLFNPEAREAKRQGLYQDTALNKAQKRIDLQNRLLNNMQEQAAPPSKAGRVLSENEAAVKGSRASMPERTPEEVKQANDATFLDAFNKQRGKGLAAAGVGSFMLTADAPRTQEEVLEQEPVVPSLVEKPINSTQTTNVSQTTKSSAPSSPSATSKETPSAAPESKELQLLDNRLKNLNLQYAQLEDPPIDSAELREDMANRIKKVRDDKEAMYMWGQLAERLVAALVKYGAAREGLAKNLDMSNAEVERTNWDKLIDRAYTRYKQDADDLIVKLDKQDKAKAQVDALRVKQDEIRTSLKERMARLEDAREAEKRREAERKQERLDRARENQLNRETRTTIANLKQSNSPGLSPQFIQTQKNVLSGLERLMAEQADAKVINNYIDKNVRYIPQGVLNNIKEYDPWGPTNTYRFKEPQGQTEEPSSSKAVVKKQYSPSRNQTKIVYSDGTQEILDGKQ